MRKFLLICIFLILSEKVFAANSANDGFYVGVDPTKMNNKIGNVNNAVSVDSKVAEDRYYGYKFSESGFFVAPEVALKNSAVSVAKDSKNLTTTNAAPNLSYNVRANFGYEFDKSFSGFITYDVGNFSYISGAQKPITVGVGNVSNSLIGVGSQINFSDSFGVKFSYSQQQFDSGSGGQIKSDVVKVGTVYSF